MKHSRVGEVSDVLVKEGAPAPHELWEQTGGGEAYRRAMIQHRYVYVRDAARCRAPNGDSDCLLTRGHSGPHLGPDGEWSK